MRNVVYRAPRFAPMVRALATRYGFDFAEAADLLKAQFPALQNKARCANCGAGMCEYEYQHDAVSAALLVAMARIVRHRLATGVAFSDANRVHVQTEVNRAAGYTVASATTRASYLGLVAKVRRRGTRTHDRKAGWLVTARGWRFLRGEPVPASVRVFRGEITARPEGTSTLADALARRPKRRKGSEFQAPDTSAEEWRDLAFKMLPFAPDEPQI